MARFVGMGDGGDPSEQTLGPLAGASVPSPSLLWETGCSLHFGASVSTSRKQGGHVDFLGSGPRQNSSAVPALLFFSCSHL